MPAIQEILLVPHTHHDVGYTHIPEVCLRMHERYIKEAVMLCEHDLEDDSPAAFRWTIEISLPLVRYLRRAASKEVERLHKLVSAGRIAVTGAYAHMTQLIGHEEYVRFFEPVRELRQTYGLPVSVVQHGDINGLSWGVVPMMQAAGLDCLVMALNPDHGRAPFEQPSAFIWEGQDGSRILVWLSLFYSLANNPWALTDGRIDAAQTPLGALMKHLEAREDYPFDFAVVHSAEDNMLPNKRLSQAVRQWNDAGLQPPLRIVTIDEAMRRAREQMARLPVYCGEWADWWANGHGSSAYEVAVSRIARTELRVAETADALAQLSGASIQEAVLPGVLPITNWHRAGNVPPVREGWYDRFNRAYEDLLLFEEHTWGTFETITHPFSLFTQTHWNSKAAFAFRAVTEAHDLSREALVTLVSTLPLAESPALVVFNPLSEPRDDLITVRTPGIDHSVFVRDLPPMGIKVVAWKPDEVDRRVEVAFPDDATLENDFYRLKINPSAGTIISLIDKATGKEWVDIEAKIGIGGVIYEEGDPSDHHPAHANRNQFHPDTPGPRFIRTPAKGTGIARLYRTHYGFDIIMETAAPYLPRIETTVKLFDAVKWLEISILIDKTENYTMEGVYVAFPFALNHPQFWLETANAVYRADEEQLPDTCRDWYSVQHGIGVTDGNHSVLWATREAPLVQLSEIQTGKWLRELKPERGHLYAWLMNNLYFTNFKAAQGGQIRFNFRLTTRSGGLNGAEVRRWGEQYGNPSLARIAPLQPGTYEWLRVEPGNVIVQTLKPSLNHPGEFVLRLKETAGKLTDTIITWRHTNDVRMFQVDLLETGQETELASDEQRFNLKLLPHQLATVRISVR
jgi:alpha-mannosidase